MVQRDGQSPPAGAVPVHCQGPIRDYATNATLHGLVEAQVCKTPDAIAICQDRDSLSYRELDQKAEALAMALRQRGLTRGQPVGVLIEPCLDLPVALFGILKAGGAYLALDPNWPEARVLRILRESQITIIVSTSRLQRQIPADCILIDRFNANNIGSQQAEATPEATKVEPDSLAYVLYTSGTSGDPKGVMISHGAATNRIFGMQETYRLSRNDVILQKTPISFDVSVWEIFWPLMAGARMVIPRPNGFRDIGYLISLIKEKKVSTLHFSPAALDLFLQFTEAGDCTSIRRVFCGGQPLTASLQAHFFEVLDAELHHLYGPTEATIDVTSWACQRGSNRTIIPIGKPVQNVSVYVLDTDGKITKPGERGEIYIGGRQVANGYLNRPDLTRDRFIADPFSPGSPARLYRTGDFGRWLSDGNLEFLGRIDHQIKLRGNRIELGEIEVILGQHPNVRQCAVLLCNQQKEPQLVAFVTCSEPDVNKLKLREYLSQHLPDFMIPAQVEIRPELPMTRHGKIDRSALACEANRPDAAPLARESKAIANRTVTATEGRLIAIWNQLLTQPISEPTDDFLAHGGDSLIANRALIRIEQEFGIRLGLNRFFEASTPEQLAILIDAPSAHPTRAALLNASDHHQSVASITTIPRATALLMEGLEAFPASFSQTRLWFLHQLEPELIAYHIPAVWNLKGDLDVQALQRALAGLIERHSTLRTSFRLEGCDVLQVVHHAVPLDLAAEALNERDPEVVIREWLEEEMQTPFDLTAGLLLRARLLRVEEQDHVLLINHHHIASDGWSCLVLVRDLTQLYNAHRKGRACELTPLRVHYQDYAAWQRQHLSGDRLQNLKDYWISQLCDLEPLELPSDHPRPAKPSYTGASVGMEIGAELLAPFEELCRSEGTTLQMGLLALVSLLLHRYSRQDDFAIGIPIWGRNHPDLEPLIGFFINTLPIRTRFTPQQSFRQLLQQVKATSLAAYDHQELPFEQIVETLNLPRDSSRNPLVQVMLQFMDFTPPCLKAMDGISAEQLSPANLTETCRFDIEFLFQRSQNGELQGEIIYSTDLFQPDRIQRLNGHLLTLLAAALEAPDTVADSLPLLPESERLLIQSWQQGAVMEIPDLFVHQLFEQQVVRTPDAIALIIGDQRLTYQQLNARTNQLAHQLIDLGVGPDRFVGICLQRGVAMVVSLLAILKAGGAYVALDPAYPKERLAFMLKDSAPLVLVVDRTTRHLLSGIKTMTVLDIDADQTLWDERADLNPDPAALGLESHHLSYLLYTSGSTGNPKGVMVEHRSVVNFIHWASREFPADMLRHTLFATSINFDLAVYECFAPLAVGGACVIVPTILEAGTTQAQISLINTVPAAMSNLLHAGTLPDSVRGINLAGEPLSRELADTLFSSSNIEQLCNLYGPTETTVYSTCSTIKRGQAFAAHIGRPIANTQIVVLDAHGQPVPIGVSGELHIGGAGVARGYLNQAELTAQRFLANPFAAENGSRMYKTGDLARWLPDGTIEFIGRTDFQVKVRGFRIEPGEIEAQLLSHPAVAQAVVILRHDDPTNPRLIAYWVPEPSHHTTASTSADQLRSLLAERLPAYMIPAAFMQLEALPLTPNGKLDRRALPDPSFSGDRSLRVEPSTGLELQLHALWAEVLGHSDFGITDNFFTLGGHSLAAARLLARMEQAIGCAPTLAALFQHPSIAELTPLLSASGASAVARPIPAAEPLSGEGAQDALAFPASYAQAGLWFLHQLEPDLTAYHLPDLWRLRGALDRSALQQALTALMERHPTLRSSFRLQGSDVLQIIHPPVPFRLDAEPLGDRSPDDVIQQWLEHEHTTPFDLSSGRLIRARLLAIDPQHHLLLLNQHHIASDGWSRSVLARDLTQLYNAQCTGRPCDLDPLRVQYQDYATWQRQRLNGDRQQKLKDYWISQLSDLEPLELPTDHPRPPIPSYKGNSVTMEIGAELLASFEELCRSEGATLQMGLLALVTLLLHRYSRQGDFAIGVPIWGRNHPDLEPLIGFFINTLPIRTRFTPQQSFRQLLQQVKATSLAAYDHQELPFEQIVEALNLPRDTSRNPLAQVILQLIELPDASLNRLNGLAAEELSVKTKSSKADLSFYFVRNTNQGLEATISYASDLFSSERIQRLTSHLLVLLSSTLEAADAPHSSLQLISEEERLLIQAWQTGPTIDAPDICVHQLFEQQAARTPEAVALVFEDHKLTYSELNSQANQLAHHLIDLGVGPEEIVAACLERSIELIVSLLAILKAGGAYLPLSTTLPNKRIETILEASQAGFFIFSRQNDGAKLEVQSDRVRRIGAPKPDPSYCSKNPHVPLLNASCLAYVLFTSGTTGTPKGVSIEHRAIARRCHFYPERWGLDSHSKVLAQSQIDFDMATREWLLPLTAGAAVILASSRQQGDTRQLSDLIAKHNCTHIAATPTKLEVMLTSPQISDRIVTAGGERLTTNLLAKLDQQSPRYIVHSFGPSETSIACTMHIATHEDLEAPSIPLGKPLPDTRLIVVDHGNQPSPIGIPGELHIGGAGLARGYLNNPELTNAKFIPDPFLNDPSARLYQSGDLASWNPDGTLSFHGRIDHQIKLRGFRIEPGEIEAQLLSHPAVAQAVVILRHDDPANPRLIAYWVPDPSHHTTASASSDQLRSLLAERLPAYMVPAACIRLETLPLTSNGKLDRKALPAPVFSGNIAQRVDPSSDLERQLHGLWAEVIGHSDFGITDNFFTIGGHSLAAARLAAAMESSLTRRVAVADLFRLPTIREQAEWLDEDQPLLTGNLVSLQPTGDRPPLYVIHGWGGKVGHFVELGKSLAPSRPVIGIQAADDRQAPPMPSQLASLISSYADQILARHPGGPIHLMGYSAGGWYAHALAAELLKSGARIGLFAVLDSHTNARIHKRIGLRLLVHKLLPRPVDKRMEQNNRTTHPDACSLLDRLRRFNMEVYRHLHIRALHPRWLAKALQGHPLPAASRDPYVALVKQQYRPPRLPLTVDVFAPPASLPTLQRLWSFYGLQGVRLHGLFEEHFDFMQNERMGELAQALEAALERVEQQKP